MIVHAGMLLHHDQRQKLHGDCSDPTAAPPTAAARGFPATIFATRSTTSAATAS